MIYFGGPISLGSVISLWVSLILGCLEWFALLMGVLIRVCDCDCFGWELGLRWCLDWHVFSFLSWVLKCVVKLLNIWFVTSYNIISFEAENFSILWYDACCGQRCSTVLFYQINELLRILGFLSVRDRVYILDLKLNWKRKLNDI